MTRGHDTIAGDGMSTDAELDYAASGGVGFGTFSAADEYFHGTGPAGDSLTETWYWGFFVPELNINCYAYCWVHPNLHVASAGLMIYEGVKQHHLAAELFDMPMFLADSFVGDGSDIRVPNGLRVQVITPLEEVHLTYEDPARETSVDVRIRALSEPVMRPSNKHFEQVVATTGELTLRGARHRVDCVSVRDRSWGELRPEGHNPSPPMTWTTGATQDGATAFTVSALDAPAAGSGNGAPAAAAFKDGWLRRDGRVLRIARAAKTTTREPSTLRPTRHVIEGEDTEGRGFRWEGEVVAGLPWGGWHNARCHLGLVRWDMDGRIAWGETIDVQWNDFIWRNS
ncbi:MAG: hypothetical protein JWO02_570 [Solirubrobacterales bacterium]|nr:hypothetical protein [Solirubrobacterales bacterium]